MEILQLRDRQLPKIRLVLEQIRLKRMVVAVVRVVHQAQLSYQHYLVVLVAVGNLMGQTKG